MGEPTDLAAQFEALIQFLYLAPVGLAQLSTDGTIGMINPISAQLLVPLSHDGTLANLFTVLEGVAPDLFDLASRFQPAHGIVCDALRIPLHGGGAARPEMLSLTLLKLDDARLMAVLSDVSVQVRRERALLQSQAWINGLLVGVDEYALVGLDRVGQVCSWNPSVQRLTGRTAEAVVGRSAACLYDPAPGAKAQLLAHLTEAEATGCSVQERWVHPVDGARFWGSLVFTPLREPCDAASATAPSCDPAGASFCLVLRDIEHAQNGKGAERHLAFVDSLSGLANRHAFFDAAKLQVACSRQTQGRLSLVLLELIPVARDGPGRNLRDQVVQRVARRLAASFADASVLARLGVDRFAALLPDMPLDVARRLADLFCQDVSEELSQGGLAVDVHAGVDAFDARMGGIDDLLEAATLALAHSRHRDDRVPAWSETLP
jgi:diguanylate cyclase (GGDEF)-like protein/PAS domain S-box-containing protein